MSYYANCRHIPLQVCLLLQNGKTHYNMDGWGNKLVTIFAHHLENRMDLPKMTLKFTRELHVFHKENHDNCTVCGKLFENNDRAHLGYNENRNFVYTCDDCRDKVAETVVRYNFTKRSFSVPRGTTILWRYIDFGKFVSMLLTKSLYFTKVSKFNDPFEGAIGIMDNKSNYDKSMIFALVVAQLSAPTNNHPPFTMNDTPEHNTNFLSRSMN